MRKFLVLVFILVILPLASAAQIKHKFVATDESGKQLLYVDETNPANDWTIPLPGNRDIQISKKGTVLVTPSPKTTNDLKSYEFFAGHDKKGEPVWTSDFDKIKPLIEWNNNMGCVTATYVPALKKYLMCITDGWPAVEKMDSYILEADNITGPWRMVVYMKDFGQQA